LPLVTAFRTALLNRGFRGTAYTTPTALAWAPYSVSPAADGTGGTEITSGGAARKTVTWGAPAAGQASNSSAVTAISGASADWPLCSAFAFHDTAHSLPMIGFGPTTPAKQVNNGQSWTLQPGEIQLADTAQGASIWLSHYLINALYTELLGGTAYSAPAHTWWGLFTAPPARDGTGGTEITGATGYARVQQDMAAASAGSISPSAGVNFGSAGSNWGLISHIGAFSALTAGNLMGLIALASAVNVLTGSPVLFPAAQLAFTET
jgi:hypothetical protein